MCTQAEMPTSAHDVIAYMVRSREEAWRSGRGPHGQTTTRAHRTEPPRCGGRLAGATTGAAHGAGTHAAGRGVSRLEQGRWGMRRPGSARGFLSCWRRGPARRSPGLGPAVPAVVRSAADMVRPHAQAGAAPRVGQRCGDGRPSVVASRRHHPDRSDGVRPCGRGPPEGRPCSGAATPPDAPVCRVPCGAGTLTRRNGASHEGPGAWQRAAHGGRARDAHRRRRGPGPACGRLACCRPGAAGTPGVVRRRQAQDRRRCASPYRGGTRTYCGALPLALGR